MNPHIPYILPLRGLSDGLHHFNYDIDDPFFQSFDDSPIQKARIKMRVQLDKRPRLLVLDFNFSGTIQSICDRCLTAIKLPINGDYQLLVKYGEEEAESDDDVIYIPQETGKWNIAQFVYEYILLAMPIIKVYDCENDDNPPCDFDLLDRLDETIPTEEEQPKANPFKAALENWKK